MVLPWFFLGQCLLSQKLHWAKEHKTSVTYLSPCIYSWKGNGLPISGEKNETFFFLLFFLFLFFFPFNQWQNAGSLKIPSWDSQYFFSKLKGFFVDNFYRTLKAILSSATTDRSNYSSHLFCTSLSLNTSRINEQILVMIKLKLDFLYYSYSEKGNHKKLSVFGLWDKGIHSWSL